MFNTSFSKNFKRKICSVFTLVFLGLFSSFAFSQGITVVEYPFFLIDQNETVQIRWLEQINATLYYGVEQNKYDRQISVSGAKSLQFSPSNEGFSPGIYYARISNGVIHSIPFVLYVESPQAPISRSPQSGAVISTISPKFEWDAVPGVPFYHFILTDQPVQIIKDAEGNLQIEGANIIYQVITSKTEINYGEPDPSGFFNQVNGIIPPLLNGKTYNWIVLNNYGNNPALSSIVQTGVQSFTVSLVINISAPVLNSPASNINISSAEIVFSWQNVNNANSYMFELFEIIEEDGSSSTFPVWQVVTTGTSVQVPARKIFKSSFYEWQVIALDEAGKGKVSERRNFTYDVPTGEISISSRTTSGRTLPRININVQPIIGNGENNDYLTSDSGILNLNIQPGTYKITGAKPGFRDTTVTVDVEVNQTSNLQLKLKILPHAILGSAKSVLNEVIATPQIFAIDAISKKRFSIIGDLVGKFRIPLVPSIYKIYAAKPGYSSQDTIMVDLTVQNEVSLQTPLLLKKNTGTLIGKVINQTGVPIFGVHILAKQNTVTFETTSNASGIFQLSLDVGSWELLAEKVGYSQENKRTISISNNQTLNLNPDLIINSQAAVINGIVTDGNIGIPYVEILAVPPEGSPVISNSNAKGNFNISVSAGIYDLFFHRNGYIDPLPRRLNLSPGQTVDNLTINLEAASVEVSGIIKSDGSVISDVIITNNETIDTSRVNGFYRLWLSVGEHQLFIKKTGYYLADPVQLSLKTGDLVVKKDINILPQAATIKGKIVSSNIPVSSAKVKAISGSKIFETKSDLNGEYKFTVASGVWSIRSEKEGFQTANFSNDLALQPGQTIQGIDLNLIPNFGTVTGQIKNSQGLNISLALVESEERQKQALSDNGGNYQLQLSPGTISLKAKKVGFGEQIKNVTVTTNQTQTVNFTLSTFGTLSGKVSDSNGVPIIQSQVHAISGNDTLTDLTDYTGEYKLFLSGGSYQLVADKLGYSEIIQQVNIQNGQVVTRNLQLQFKPEELANITGKVTIDNQTPLSNTLLKVSGRMNKISQSDNAGSFSFEKLESGYDYWLQPSLRNHFFIPSIIEYSPLNSDKSGQNFVASLYGDLSSNQEVSSFDGSLILRISARKDISPHFTTFPRDSLAADVSGNKKISSFDASLIFRFAVNLISIFPADENTASSSKIKIDSSTPVQIFTSNEIDDRYLDVHFFCSEPISFYSFDARLIYSQQTFEPISVSPSQQLKSFYRDWNAVNGELNISMAGTELANCSDTLFSVTFENRGFNETFSQKSVEITKLEIDEGAVPIEIKNEKSVPDQFYLSQNYPNPFNQSTLIQLSLPDLHDDEDKKLKIEIYNLLGKRVRTLVNETTAPGYYSITWSGKSDSKQVLASGIYLLRVQYAKFNDMKKMVIVR